jgi:hypothetical protein
MPVRLFGALSGAPCAGLSGLSSVGLSGKNPPRTRTQHLQPKGELLVALCWDHAIHAAMNFRLRISATYAPCLAGPAGRSRAAAGQG